MNLADQLSAYAVKLLDKVRGHKELDCVLGKTGKESEEKYVLLARLYLAIKYEEKPVGEILTSRKSIPSNFIRFDFENSINSAGRSEAERMYFLPDSNKLLGILVLDVLDKLRSILT